MRLTPALLVLLAACGVAGAQPMTAAVQGRPVEEERTAQQCMDLVSPKPKAGKLCTDFDNCVSYCSCACTFYKERWGKEKRDTECPKADVTGTGMLASTDPLLLEVKGPFTVLTLPSTKVFGTQAVLDGLKRLDDALITAPKRAEKKFKVRIGTCYRTHLEDTEKECGLVLKASYMLGKVAGDADKENHWRSEGNPQNKGLAWPGATPHSAGAACDIVLQDEKGQDCFDWRAGTTPKAGESGPPTCDIEAREAVQILTDIVTSDTVGGKRLNYEAWHFEWDGPFPDARCQGERCLQYWPLTGKPN